jgi:hypothetical protein
MDLRPVGAFRPHRWQGLRDAAPDSGAAVFGKRQQHWYSRVVLSTAQGPGDRPQDVLITLLLYQGRQRGRGEARNRLRNAVERTVPFGLITYTLATLWYATKTEPPLGDMIIKLRRVIIATRSQHPAPYQPQPEQIRAMPTAWAVAETRSPKTAKHERLVRLWRPGASA